MKIFQWIFLISLSAFLGFGAYRLVAQNAALGKNIDSLKTELESLKQGKEKIESEIRYLSVPANLVKNLKSGFNYREPGEKMIILVR